jgi:hypothetical protein
MYSQIAPGRAETHLWADYANLLLKGEIKANILCYDLNMDEGRKRVLLIAATILAARKLAQFDKPCPGIESAIANAVAMAEKIMRKIDAMYPAKINEAKEPYKY